MAQHSATLKVGECAPDFSLPSANGMGDVSLAKLRERGPVVVEFLRGTW
jgi:peroxiredoxin